MQAVAARLVVLTMLGISGPSALLTVAQAAPAAQAVTKHPVLPLSHAEPATAFALAAAAEPGAAAQAAADPLAAAATAAVPSATLAAASYSSPRLNRQAPR